jgi:hypothetical protein
MQCTTAPCAVPEGVLRACAGACMHEQGACMHEHLIRGMCSCVRMPSTFDNIAGTQRVRQHKTCSAGGLLARRRATQHATDACHAPHNAQCSEQDRRRTAYALQAKNVRQIAAGGEMSACITEAGELYRPDLFRPLGPIIQPARCVPSVHAVMAAWSCCMLHVVKQEALSIVGRFTWGEGLWGQLGHGDTVSHSVPHEVALPDRRHSASMSLCTFGTQSCPSV